MRRASSGGRRSNILTMSDDRVERELFFRSSSDPCFVLDVDEGPRYTLSAINPAYERLTGLRAADIVGRSPVEYMPPDVRATVEQRLGHVAATGEIAEYVEQLSFPAGARVWRTRLIPIRNDRGQVRRLLGFGRDLTDARRAEASLAASERRYRELLETLYGGVWQIDREGMTTFVNPRMAEMLGYRVSEMIGRHLLEFCEGSWRDFARAKMTERGGGGKGDYEFEFRGKDGRRVHTLVSSAPQYDENGRYAGAVGGVHDITERLRAQEEREMLERKLLETQKLESLGVLAGGIAHDFNNILTGILGSTSLARMELAPGGRAEEHIVHVEVAARRAADLCRQMLAYAGKGRFLVQLLDLSEIVRETTQLLDLSISRKATVRYDLANALPPLLADATQLRQVLMNLVLNASEALGDRPGSITLTTGTQLVDAGYLRTAAIEDELPSGPYIFLEVSDDGSGMSRETVERIFDPFFTTKFTGRGLGLSAVLGIVRGHRGAVKVYSELGRGTTFRLLFPAAEGEEAGKGARGVGDDEWRGQGAVLIIDDETTVRGVTERILQAIGFEPVPARDGVQGVEIVRQRGESLVGVLLDLTMPNMDGETAFREITLLRPELPIVLMSGYNEGDAIARFAGQGLAGFLQKPFTVDDIRKQLRAALTRA
jgi:two-component system, cell cycle sensor histidine kinase and response regulator CckA